MPLARMIASSAVPAQPVEEFLPVRTVRADRRPCWFVGCHGGAATTTLANLVKGGADAGRYWPIPESGAPARVVLVARSNSAGLAAAQAAARQWALGSLNDQVELLGLAVVADAPGRLPKPLRDHLDLVAGAVPAVWFLPWVDALRLGGALDQRSVPAPYRVFMSDLADLGWVDRLRMVAAEEAREE